MKSLCLVTVINPTIVVLVSHLSEVVDIAEKFGERKFLNTLSTAILEGRVSQLGGVIQLKLF